ncbi:hypothetical protein [Ruegeria sp. Alg231-54]|uniref:hypothetical protein n=1 Tax=Ruegeria sp. Alg231-54 TaxID=1922221 RepID=UPI000D551A90|nr:hypothetical protein [Ruegeria sp. Alg231-54]
MKHYTARRAMKVERILHYLRMYRKIATSILMSLRSQPAEAPNAGRTRDEWDQELRRLGASLGLTEGFKTALLPMVAP